MVDIRSILFNIFICITFYYRCLISLNESVEDSKDFMKDFVVMYWLYYVHTRGRVLLKVIDNDDFYSKLCVFIPNIEIFLKQKTSLSIVT